MKSKLLLILFISIGSLTFQSCKKDSGSSPAISLKGRWDATAANVEIFENNVSKQKTSAVADKGDFYFIFDDTKVELYIDSKLEDDGTYTYNASSQMLTIKYDANNSETLQLSNVKSTSFSLVQEDSQKNGTITTKTVSEIAFKKQ